MKVKELIEMLSVLNPEAEIQVPTPVGDFSSYTCADEVYEEFDKCGIATPNPSTYPVVRIV